MRSGRVGLTVLAAGLALSLLSAAAWATHKNWTLRDSGATCMTTSAGGPVLTFTNAAVVNGTTSSQSVICPVTLAGRYSGTHTGLGSFPMAEWATALGGFVSGFDGSSTDGVTCFLDTRSSTGGQFLSRSASTSSSGMGNFRIDVYDLNMHTWGNILGNRTDPMRAIGFRCSLPNNSTLYSYQVHICQFDKRNKGIPFPCTFD